MSNSLFYGAPVSVNAFPTYTTDELKRDLESDKLDTDTRRRIETEILRRSIVKKGRRPLVWRR